MEQAAKKRSSRISTVPERSLVGTLPRNSRVMRAWEELKAITTEAAKMPISAGRKFLPQMAV